MKRTIAVAVLLITIAGFIGIRLQTGRASGAVNITLYGSYSAGWGLSDTSFSSPGPTLTVNEGDTVNMTLVSSDGMTHRFYVDYNANGIPDVGEPDSGDFNTSTNLVFTANTNGTFTYYCYIHPTIMYGTFVVTQAIPEFSSMWIPTLIMATLILGAAVVRTAKVKLK